MTVTGNARPRTHSWPDDRLVRECLDGDQAAWSRLIDKYKRLIYSIPIRYGLPEDAATDVFQDVCLTLVAELPRLRKPKALAAWLIQTTSRRSLQWKQECERYSGDDARAAEPASGEPEADSLLQQVVRDQALREALDELPSRCRRLVEMLFFQEPARPYEEIARSFGIATGSIGFIRMRCLGRLRGALLKKGFR